MLRGNMDKQLPLVDALRQADLQPLWDRYMTLLTSEPSPVDWPLSWSWEGLQPLIERAVAEVGMEDAERRVLLLAHPAFAPHAYTTTNLSGALQVLQPGEHAPPHRHTVSALRYVIEGEGAVTCVNGKRCEMAEGDLILTPSWCWHEHRNEGEHRVVWFDGLDMPLAHHLRSVFLEFGQPAEMPETVDDSIAIAGAFPAGSNDFANQPSPRYRYAGSAISTALDATIPGSDGSRQLRYTNPVTGGPVMATLDCYALRLRAKAATRAFRSTSGAIAVVANGSGTSWIGNRTVTWQKNDVFSIPHWHWVRHRAEDRDTQLFIMTDKALLEAMGYLHTEFE